MKKIILGIALVTMIVSCKKETKVEEHTMTDTTTVEKVPEPVVDTVVTKTKTETTVDTIGK